MNRTFGVALSALFLAGAMTLAGSAPASALTAKECRAQWEAAKSSGADPGTYKAYKAANCGDSAAPAAAAPAPAPAATPAPAPAATPAPAPAPAKPAPAPASTKPMPAPTGAGEFANESDAKGHCPSDTVVWVNTKTKIFHYAGHPKYGHTKHGAYMCEADAKAAGDRASKSEQPKQ